MRLYIVLLLVPFLSHNLTHNMGKRSNLWSTQNNIITMTNEQKELYTQLKSKKAALKKFLKANNLNPNVLNKEQRQIVVKANKILKACEEEIGKDDFVVELVSILSSYAQKMRGLTSDKTPMKIDELNNLLSSTLRMNNYLINQQIYQSIQQGITNAKDNKRNTIALAIAAELEKYTRAYAEKLIKENKAIKQDLKKVKSLKDILPSATEFEAALMMEHLEDKEDENHPDKVAAREEKTEKDKAEKEEKEKALIGEYQSYMNEYTSQFARDVNLVKLGNPEALPDTVIIDMQKLLKGLNKAIAKDNDASNTPISKDLQKHMSAKLSGKSYHTLDEVKSVVNTWIRDASVLCDWSEAQFEVWKQNKTGFPNTALVAAAINDAYVNIDVDTIVSNLTAWTKGVKDAFVMPKNYTINTNKMQRNFNELFDESSNSGVSTSFIYEDCIQKYLDKVGGAVKIETLKNEVWERVLLEVVKAQNIESHFNEEWLPQYGPYAIKSFNNELDSLLPTAAEIQQALLKSIERKRKLQMEETPPNDSLQPLIFLRSEKDTQTISKRLLVKLKYENYPTTKDGNIEDVINVVPTSIKLLADSSQPSKLSITLVSSSIRRTKTYKTGGCMTEIHLKFMAVKDVQKLFNSIDTEDLKYKGIDLVYWASKFDVKLSGSGSTSKKSVSKKNDSITNSGDVKATASAGSLSIQDFIYESTNVDYFDVVLKIQSDIDIGNGSSKQVKLNAFIESKDETNWTAKFESNKDMLSTYYRPIYNYK